MPLRRRRGARMEKLENQKLEKLGVFSALTAEKTHGMDLDGGCAAVMDVVWIESMNGRTR